MNAYVMDDVDRRLLDIIQTNFPLSPRPYAELGQQTGISEEEALRRVNALRAARIIRRKSRIAVLRYGVICFLQGVGAACITVFLRRLAVLGVQVFLVKWAVQRPDL